MSFHHGMMLQRYGLGRVADMHSAICADPFLSPLLVSAGLTGSFSIGAFAVSYATVATAICALGGFGGFNIERN